MRTSAKNGPPTTFDVFLCHNSADAESVAEIGTLLKHRGLVPWVASEQLRPGVCWQRELEKLVSRTKCVAVLVGESGSGPWQDLEIGAFLRKFARRGCTIIPVILPGGPKRPKLPLFLDGMVWVDFRREQPDPLEQLIWGITGARQEIR